MSLDRKIQLFFILQAFFSGVVALSGAISLLLLAVPEVPSPPGLKLQLVTDNLPPESKYEVLRVFIFKTYKESRIK